jgi:mannose-6-phosphate isomerase-like protein (cupin superfamily)
MENIMSNSSSTALKASFLGGLFAMTMLGVLGNALAQSVPHSFIASPDVYKVIAENEQYRVVAVTWKPGQRDAWHSHPVAAVYNLTDCNMRVYTPDGKSRDSNTKVGASRVNPPVPSHSLENVGQTECRLIIFEPK